MAEKTDTKDEMSKILDALQKKEQKDDDKKTKSADTKPKKRVKKADTVLAKKTTESLVESPDKAFDLYKQIHDAPLRKSLKPASVKDSVARDVLDREIPKKYPRGQVFPGMMLMFDYFTPKTMDKLEYYDARPCVIFFGTFNSSLGKRILGFNIHYYPPQLRYRILSWLFDNFKADFEAHWDDNKPQKITSFNYVAITNKLKQVKLDFGVREYDPALIKNVKKVSPKYFQVAAFTEGQFKKETRQQILSYWKGRVTSKF